MAEENYWVIIPPPVVGDDKLPSGAKLVFGRINALIKVKGYCYASNEFLGKHLDLTKGTVSAYVTLLRKRGHIRVDLIRDKNGTGQVKERRIYTHLSNFVGGGIVNPIQLKLEKSIENSKDSRSNKGMEKLGKIVDNFRPKYA